MKKTALLMTAFVLVLFGTVANAQTPRSCADCGAFGRKETLRNGSVWDRRTEGYTIHNAGGDTVKQILDRLALKYSFSYSMDPNTDPSILGANLVDGAWDPQPLRTLLPAILGICGSDGNCLGGKVTLTPTSSVALIHGRPFPQQTRVDTPLERRTFPQPAPRGEGYVTRPIPAPTVTPRIVSPIGPHQPSPAYIQMVQAVESIEARRRAYEDVYGFGGPGFAATAPTRLGVPSQHNLAGIPDPNMPHLGAGHYRNMGLGIGNPYSYGGRYTGGYGGYMGGAYGGYYMDCSVVPSNRYCTHGTLRIDGPGGPGGERWLRGIDIYVDGSNKGPASKYNRWPNKGAMIPVGEHKIQFVNHSGDIVYETMTTIEPVYVTKKEPNYIRVDKLRMEKAPFRKRIAHTPNAQLPAQRAEEVLQVP